MGNIKLNAKQLRVTIPTPQQLATIKRAPAALILDGVEDSYNIGSLFRLADALALSAVYLCGQVVTPPNPKIHRSSVGTWRWVPWYHYSKITPLLIKLKKQGWQIIAGEQTKNAVLYTKFVPRKPFALIVGHETRGVSSAALKQADAIVEIPLFGVNKSLNVLVAATILLYHWLVG